MGFVDQRYFAWDGCDTVRHGSDVRRLWDLEEDAVKDYGFVWRGLGGLEEEEERFTVVFRVSQYINDFAPDRQRKNNMGREIGRLWNLGGLF